MTGIDRRYVPRTGTAVGRRVFLNRLGGTVFGVVVVSTLPACSGAGEVTGADRASRTGSSGAGATAASPASPAATEAAVDWRRVDFGFVSAYILVRDGEAAIVDTGVAGGEGDIEEALTELGMVWTDVGHVIITHRHPDHAGSVPAVLERTPDATAYAGPGDAEAIDAPGTVRVVDDGDTVFDLRIIATPGHTAGHISVLDDSGGLLVAGDALTGGDDGTVAGPDPQYTEDLAQAYESVRKLAGLRFGTVVFGHGEPVSHDADAAVANLAERLSPAPSPPAQLSPDDAPTASSPPAA